MCQLMSSENSGKSRIYQGLVTDKEILHFEVHVLQLFWPEN